MFAERTERKTRISKRSFRILRGKKKKRLLQLMLNGIELKKPELPDKTNKKNHAAAKIPKSSSDKKNFTERDQLNSTREKNKSRSKEDLSEKLRKISRPESSDSKTKRRDMSLRRENMRNHVHQTAKSNTSLLKEDLGEIQIVDQRKSIKFFIDSREINSQVLLAIIVSADRVFLTVSCKQEMVANSHAIVTNLALLNKNLRLMI